MEVTRVNHLEDKFEVTATRRELLVVAYILGSLSYNEAVDQLRVFGLTTKEIDDLLPNETIPVVYKTIINRVDSNAL